MAQTWLDMCANCERKPVKCENCEKENKALLFGSEMDFLLLSLCDGQQLKKLFEYLES